MFRLSSFCFLLILVWYSIGVGYTFEINGYQYGSVSRVTKENVRKNVSLPMPATLLANNKINSFESLTFVGDILLARNVEYLIRENDSTYPFSGFDLSSLGVSPAIIGNFEAAIPKEHVPTPLGQIDFSVTPENISGLEKAGFTHLSLANNHSYDFGADDFRNTQEKLSEQHTPFGHPKSVSSEQVHIIEVSSKRVALIGINGLNNISSENIRKTIREVSVKSDLQIIYIHWGEEYALKHSKSQSSLAEEMVSYGADLIIGHHPHVVQGVDLIDGVLVFYSLGNYIFDQYFSKDVQEGLVISVNFESDIEISLLPVTSKQSLSQPQLMNAKEHARFLEQLSRKSHPDLKSSIIKGLISTDVEFATSSKVAIMHGTNRYVQ